jgi:V/A-type H+-transporting ATPase subunit I
MARDRVVKAEILSHSIRKQDVLMCLEKTGKIHLIDISAVEDAPLSRQEEFSSACLNSLSTSLEKVIPFLQYRDKSVERKAVSVLSVDELSQMLQSDEIKETVSRAAAVFEELLALHTEKEEIRRKLDFIREWEDLPIRLDQVGRNGLFTIRAGHVSSADGFASLEQLENSLDLFHFQKLSDSRAVVIWHKNAETEVLKALIESGFAYADFGVISSTPAEEVSKLSLSLVENTDQIAVVSSEADAMVQKLPSFKALSDAAGLQSLREKAAASGRASRSSLLMHVWIRESDVALLESNLEELGEVAVSLLPPDENETPPVYLSEKAAADPYLMLTDMYGRPGGADPDPTPILAPFYLVFFGICIGDAGYGLALVAGTALGWYLTKKKQGNTRLFRLLFQGGIAGIFWGILLGGWFGIPFNNLPFILQAAAMPLNSLVPGYIRGGDGFSVSNQFLYLTLGFGLVQLAWGVVVNLQKRLRAGEGLIAVVDQTGWMLALLGLFPWLFNHYLLNGALYPTPGIWDRIFIWMLGTGALLIFFIGGREAKGIGGKAGLGAYACYGIVNLLGDVLSYSRLFALGLSGAIIASVINQIAGMLQGSIPVLGIFLAIPVLVAGHLFNLGMGVLSGFIHTTRLQFVEFFGKFYSGTGSPFTPLRYEPRYIRIKR